MSPLRLVKPAQLDPQQLLAVWRGTAEDAYGELAVVATMALALRGLERSREDAFAEARQYWAQRNLSR
jgi:anthranilate phosphoribosyltransferase